MVRRSAKLCVLCSLSPFVSFLTSGSFHTPQFGFLDRSCSAPGADFHSPARLARVYRVACTAEYTIPPGADAVRTRLKSAQRRSPIQFSFRVLPFPPTHGPHLIHHSLCSLLYCYAFPAQNHGGLLNSSGLARQRANARVIEVTA